MMVTVSLDSPSCEVTLLILYSVVYRDVTRQAKGLYRLKHVGALGNGLTYLSRYNSGWFCHTSKLGKLIQPYLLRRLVMISLFVKYMLMTLSLVLLMKVFVKNLER
jgi:hypothetical protein